jgi:parvulin-like peptidyl-prolyl isomerase
MAQAPTLDKMDIVMRSVPDGPVARVNKTYLQKEDFALVYEAQLRMAMARTNNQNLPDGARIQIGLECVGMLIEQEMMYQQAEAQNVTVSDEDVKKAATAQLEKLAKGMSKEGEPPLSQKDILAKLGYTDPSQVEAEIRRVMIIREVRNKVLSEKKTEVDEKRIQEVYEANKDNFSAPSSLHLKQIYINAQTESKTVRAEAQKKAEKALGVLYSGKLFEAVAKEYSDASNAPQGGDLGPIPIQKLPPFLVEASESLAPGEFSEVIDSEYGFHIVQLVGRTSANDIDREKVEEAIRTRMEEDQGQNIIRAYVDELIAKGTHIEVFIELQENLSRLPQSTELPLQ